MRAPPLLLLLLAGTAPRPWLERLAILIPAPAATRWLLIADVACLVALGWATGRPRLGVPLMLGAGFIALNGLGMAVTDFYLGLALFHLTVGIAVVLLARRIRWLGVATLALTLGLGLLT